MKIAIGADHAGYEYKELIIEYLKDNSHQVEDLGTYDEEAADYADYAYKVAVEVKEARVDFGILICGTGIGMSMAANKVKGIRAAVVSSKFTAEASKNHNHANIIALGSRVNTIEEVYEFIEIFMKTEMSKEQRHINRVKKIQKCEESNE